MKHLVLILICLAGITYTHGQIVIEVRKDNDTGRVFTKVQVKGAFPGGDTSWRSHLEKDLNTSMVIDKSAKKGKYIVVVNYIVTKGNMIADVICENDPGYGICQESIRIIKKSVRWGPAKVRNVNAYRR